MDKKDDVKNKAEGEAEMVERAEIEEEELVRLARASKNRAVDDGEGSRMGGMGAQGAQTDFGNPGRNKS